MSIPVNRIIENLDRSFAKKDFDAAENLLKYWLSEFRAFRCLPL